MRLFLSSMCKRPLEEYLRGGLLKNVQYGQKYIDNHNRGSFEFSSSKMVSYGVPKGYILGLSMDGPGKRTADPVPYETTRYPAFLGFGM